tara:strand:+ start:767 stop:3337 length:2571 start_codon:yes stop_codon:yes gene_type:complete
MVLICDTPYPQDTSFQSHFEQYPFPLSDFQKYAIQGIIEKQHVLVTAHTGSGKTLPAEFAIQYFASKGKKLIYTSPIKALSNQKFHDFSQKFPHISFGLFTGDIKTNPDADVLIMTTEILMNYLFNLNKKTENATNLQFEINIQDELSCVVFDEVHYINDKDRGQVWEKTMMMLPSHVQMVMLSATIDNPKGFAEWCENIHTENENKKTVYLSSTNHRVVPLTHYGFLTNTESIFKYVKDKTIQKEIKDSTNKLILLRDPKGAFNEPGYNTILKMEKLFKNNNQYMKRKHVLNQLALFLKDKEMLPAIAFIFSRKLVESCAHDITVPLLEFDSKIPYTVGKECEQIIRKLPNYQEYLNLPEYRSLVSLLEKGIGIHHSGMIPILREIVELMISKKYIKLLFATESFAIGLDCPIKTAIFTNITKFDGSGERFLHSHEYTQMAGRAGRRGIDKIGHVVHCNNLFSTPSKKEYQCILNGNPQKLVSKFHISYPLVLNVLKNGEQTYENICNFSAKSMIKNSIDNSLKNLYTTIQQKEQDIQSFSFQSNVPVDCLQQFQLQNTIFQTKTNNQRKKADKEIKRLKGMYRDIEKDSKQYGIFTQMKDDLKILKDEVNSTNDYFQIQSDKIISLLVQDKFIKSNSHENIKQESLTNPSSASYSLIEPRLITYSLTEQGSIASNIAEVHPIIMTRLLEHWNYFQEFTTIQLVGLFSCFTDIKLPSDERYLIPSSEDRFINEKVCELNSLYDGYNSLEQDKHISSGIRYEDALQYNLIDIAMKWCQCETEGQCKEFIEKEVKEWSISIGDFTKAMLKIVTITKELVNVFETEPILLNYLDTLQKLKDIEPLVLKYVMTSQSLYV